ncbi:AlpA family phage regulatory protein [Bradyrhizobium sp. Leo121]|uniref:helix-turn-helix transcriptional regulator n=1 Tax=Bradyrhizobium sp. Leo121 TaxID=1571195 RepID=UPI0010298F67|nr:AlpA family phage regulatory protein [Bradyrhizobium sp. Leo121]RZN25581.1 AlpA family transcriptional regulator [Bradyrhizobium sp. Leo121]
MPEQSSDLARVVRAREVCRLIGLSRPTLWRLVQRDQFPKPFRLSSSAAVGWLETDILAWIAARAAQRDSPKIEPRPSPPAPGAANKSIPKPAPA